MNERIRELAEQATSTLSVKHEGYGGKGYTEQVEFFDKEKFAQLIVAECAGVCEQYRGTEWGKAAECVSDSIREHFGVEQ